MLLAPFFGLNLSLFFFFFLLNILVIDDWVRPRGGGVRRVKMVEIIGYLNYG